MEKINEFKFNKMKAKVQYNDLIGSAAADISDHLNNDLNAIGQFFKIDEQRFKIIGLSIYGTQKSGISLICIDKQESTENSDHIVKMYFEDVRNLKDLSFIFKRLEIVLYAAFDNKYPNIEECKEINYSDYHKLENEE